MTSKKFNPLKKLSIVELVHPQDWENHEESIRHRVLMKFAEQLKPFIDGSLEASHADHGVLGKELMSSIHVTTDNALKRAEQEEADARVLRHPELVRELSVLIHCYEHPESPLNDPEEKGSREHVKVAQRYLIDERFHRLITALVGLVEKEAE